MSRMLSTALLVSWCLYGCGEASDTHDPTPSPEAGPDDAAELPESKEEAAQSSIDGKADFSLDLCAHRGWYGDGACDWFCLRPDPDCAATPLGPEPSGHPTQHPILLLHGFNSGASGPWSFFGVHAALEADGHTVHTTEVPAFATIEDRAGWLADQVDDILASEGADKVNLVAHSMGGLDARYLVAGLGYGDRVASVTTLSTPHRGSRAADVALGLVPGALEDAVDFFATLFARSYNGIRRDADVQAALTALSTGHMAEFNRTMLDVSGVHYQSWAGVSSVLGLPNPRDRRACQDLMLAHDGHADRMNPLLLAGAAAVAGPSLEPNDGMVTVASARWGVFRGCIPADHLDEIGQPGRSAPDPHTGFDHIRFHRNLAFDLARDGL